MKHLVVALNGVIGALERLSADTYNKHTVAAAQSILASLENFYAIVLLEIWVQVLASVDHCQRLLQDPTCDVMTARDVLKKLGQSFSQKCNIIVEVINRETSWCEGRAIPLEKQQ